MKDEPQFRESARMLIACTKMAKIIGNHRAAQDIEKAIKAFVDVTVRRIDELEAENRRLRGETAEDDVPLV